VSSRRAPVVAAVLLWRCGALLDVPEKPELAAAEHRMHTPRSPEQASGPSRFEPESSVDDGVAPVRPDAVAVGADAGRGIRVPSADGGSRRVDGGLSVEPAGPPETAPADAGIGASYLIE
jgi:hypothetical protein